MPLTPKGEEIKSAMEREYGADKGGRVFYASKNAGTITGVDRADKLSAACDAAASLSARCDAVDEMYATADGAAERLWRVRGTMRGKPVETKVEAKDYNDAVRKASGRLIVVKEVFLLRD